MITENQEKILNFYLFKQRFIAQMQQPLPGYEAQYKMAREFRDHPIDTEKYHQNARLGAVLILLYPNKNNIHTALIQRPTYEGVHSAQIAFPGGKKEDEDISLIQTALREADEEVGIKLHEVEVVGSLTPLYIPPSNFLVTPVIAFSNMKPQFVAQASEVDEILEVNIYDFLQKEIIKEKILHLQHNISLNVKYYDIQNKTIWGATAMMIAELSEILNQLE